MQKHKKSPHPENPPPLMLRYWALDLKVTAAVAGLPLGCLPHMCDNSRPESTNLLRSQMGQIQNFQDLFSLRGLCPCCTPAPLPAALEGPRAWSPRPTLPRAGEEQAPGVLWRREPPRAWSHRRRATGRGWDGAATNPRSERPRRAMGRRQGIGPGRVTGRGIVKGDKVWAFRSFASMCFIIFFFFLPFNPRNTNGVTK